MSEVLLAELRSTTDPRRRNDLAIRILDDKTQGGEQILIDLLRDPTLHNQCGTLLWALGEMGAIIPAAVLGAIIDNPAASWEAKSYAWEFIDSNPPWPSASQLFETLLAEPLHAQAPFPTREQIERALTKLRAARPK